MKITEDQIIEKYDKKYGHCNRNTFMILPFTYSILHIRNTIMILLLSHVYLM